MADSATSKTLTKPHLSVAVLRWFRDLYTAPFRTEILGTNPQPFAEREQRRRSALLRLVVFSLFIIQQTLAAGLFLWLLGTGSFPSSNEIPPAGPIAQFGLLIFCVISWLINQRKQTMLASGIFVFGMLSLVVIILHFFAVGVSDQTLFISSFLAIFIIAAGLLLPRIAIWYATAVLIVTTSLNITFDPLARQQLADPAMVRGPAVALLLLFYLFVGTLTWVFARSAQASIEATERALAREQEMTTLKDLFLMDANHELRTPIMALYGSVELIKAVGNSASEEEHERLLDRALHAGDTLLQFLDSVLDAGSIEAKSLRLATKPITLAPLLSILVTTFDPREIGESGPAVALTAYRPVTIDVDPTLAVVADETRLRQVVLNLISNALKYSHSGSPLRLSATVVNEGVRVSLRDWGYGIPSAEMPRLFQRFVRLERDIGGNVRGTGVGLYVCRVLVGAMGGHIWVESSGISGQGSTFHFTLPLAPSEPLSTLPDTLPRARVISNGT